MEQMAQRQNLLMLKEKSLIHKSNLIELGMLQIRADLSFAKKNYLRI